MPGLKRARSLHAFNAALPAQGRRRLPFRPPAGRRQSRPIDGVLMKPASTIPTDPMLSTHPVMDSGEALAVQRPIWRRGLA